jgi:hypothetical protein
MEKQIWRRSFHLSERNAGNDCTGDLVILLYRNSMFHFMHTKYIMKRIWKYSLVTNNVQIVEMPKGAEILTVRAHYDVPYLWAIVDLTAPKEKKTILTYGASYPITREGIKYIDSYSLYEDKLIFHVFEQVDDTPEDATGT